MWFGTRFLLGSLIRPKLIFERFYGASFVPFGCGHFYSSKGHPAILKYVQHCNIVCISLQLVSSCGHARYAATHPHVTQTQARTKCDWNVTSRVINFWRRCIARACDCNRYDVLQPTGWESSTGVAVAGEDQERKDRKAGRWQVGSRPLRSASVSWSSNCMACMAWFSSSSVLLSSSSSSSSSPPPSSSSSSKPAAGPTCSWPGQMLRTCNRNMPNWKLRLAESSLHVPNVAPTPCLYWGRSGARRRLQWTSAQCTPTYALIRWCRQTPCPGEGCPTEVANGVGRSGDAAQRVGYVHWPEAVVCAHRRQAVCEQPGPCAGVCAIPHRLHQEGGQSIWFRVVGQGPDTCALPGIWCAT